MTKFRCSAQSLGRAEPLRGTASTVRAFLLLEFPGAWGRDIFTDSRLPGPIKEHLGRAASPHGVKPLLIRRHGRHDAGLRVFAAYADPHQPRMETVVLDRIDDLTDLRLDALGRGDSLGLDSHTAPVFLTCTHGRHDTCCAELGRPVAAALAATHAEYSWEVSHIGGDRFAANVLVMPDGLYYGRVTAASAPSLAERHFAGQLSLDEFRGRSGYPFAVQAAEGFLREQTGMTATRALRLVSRTASGDHWTVRFDGADGAGWQVRLSVERGAAELLTCAAHRPDAAPSYRLHDISRLTPPGDETG